MIKDIEFRGKTDDGEWVYGDLMKDPGGFCFIRYVQDHNPCWAEHFKLVQAKTIGFHAGLKDKRGKKIFTGDLIKHPDFGPDEVLEISFASGCFEIGGWDCARTNFKKGEVVGNVHDNPGMVKK